MIAFWLPRVVLGWNEVGQQFDDRPNQQCRTEDNDPTVKRDRNGPQCQRRPRLRADQDLNENAKARAGDQQQVAFWSDVNLSRRKHQQQLRERHEMKDCTGLEVEFNTQPDVSFGKETQFIFVRLNVLKEYLSRELDMPNLPFPYEFERVIDDWVFMCFFVGNDFLPHLPSLEIRENAIDRLITLYKKCVYKTQGYLTDSGDVALERVEMIMRDLGHVEDEIFRDRQKNEEKMKARNKRMKLEKERQQRPNFNMMSNTQFAPVALGRGK